MTLPTLDLHDALHGFAVDLEALLAQPSPDHLYAVGLTQVCVLALQTIALAGLYRTCQRILYYVARIGCKDGCCCSIEMCR